MPRQAHGRPLASAGPAKTRKRKPAKGRGLNALEAAEKQFPEKLKIRQHRLGEDEDDDTVPQSRADADGRSAKRRKIDINNEDASSIDGGSDFDGQRWHVGVDDEDEDSDIDSDEAFGESDEERFAGFTFRGSSTNASGPRPQRSKTEKRGNTGGEDTDDTGNDEDMSEDDEDLGEDAIDLAAALDMNEEEERKLSEVPKKKTASQQRKSRDVVAQHAVESDISESESQSQDASDALSEISLSADEDDTATAGRLRAFIDGLTPAQAASLKSNLSSRSSALPSKPSQYALPSAGLSAADLMQYVKDPTQRQSLKIIQAAEQEEPVYQRGGVPGKLAAPLAKRQQDRLDRVAAYDQGKKTLERWVDTVKQNRRAEHVSYPLVDPAKASASAVKSFQPAMKTQPQTDLESKIQEIMRESGIDAGGKQTEETAEQRYEELKEKKIPLEEVQARRKELRLQRELMFREEIRARRIKKIKSKAFRRVHRKERDKFEVQERERLAAAGMLDSDEERERNDKRRAEERMGARHRESKWAKAAKATGQTTWNEDAKMGVSELARRDEELRRRIEGRTVRNSDESGDESESDSDSYSAADDEKDRWQEKLSGVDRVPVAHGKSKLADMAFMKKAEATRRAQNDEELRLLRGAMLGGEDGVLKSDSEYEDQPVRQRFGQTKTSTAQAKVKAVEKNEFEARLSEDEDDIDHTESLENQRMDPATTAGPQRTHASAGFMQSGNVYQTYPPEAEFDTRPIKSSGTLVKTPGVPRRTHRSRETALDDYTSPSESEQETQKDGLDEKGRLALEIFAGDDEEDLKKQFEKEKMDTVEEEGDQVVDNTLPGWGSWTGAGISKREQRKAKGLVLSTVKGVAPDKRKDAKLDRVIVNEKRVKKNGRYLAVELPHPYESRQQYERAMRLPMGPEWSTRNHFQDSIKPRVLLKQGQVIRPLAKPTAS